MWILLMVMFSNPYQIHQIKILGKYVDKKVCVSEVNRAKSIKVARKLSFGCIKIEPTDVSHIGPKKEI
jgi:hypothetical protein